METSPLLWQNGSPFWGFLAFSDWLHDQIGKSHGIPLHQLAEQVFTYLTTKMAHEPSIAAATIWRDYRRGGRSDRPRFLLNHLPAESLRVDRRTATSRSLKRQLRRLG